MELNYRFKGLKQTLEDFNLLDQQTTIYLDLAHMAVFTTEQTVECNDTTIKVYQPTDKNNSPSTQKELRDLCLLGIKENIHLVDAYNEKISFIEEYISENPIELKNSLKVVKAYNANVEGIVYLNKETKEIIFSVETCSDLVKIVEKKRLLTFKHNEKITNAFLMNSCLIAYLDL